MIEMKQSMLSASLDSGMSQTKCRTQQQQQHNNNYYYYYRFTAPWIVSGTTRVSWYQKGKTNLDLLEQEIVSGSGISGPYANLHLGPDSYHANIPPLSFFTCQMPFLPPNQQRQSIEGNSTESNKCRT